MFALYSISTMTEQLTPPPELFKQWEDDILNERDNVDHVLDCAWKDGFRAGADQELEACCEWVEREIGHGREWGAQLRAARRPKPPSLREQALQELERVVTLLMPVTGPNKVERFAIIRRALEQLDD